MKPVIAITMGDFNGIGPEVVLKSLQSPVVRRICTPLLVGSAGVFEYYARKLGMGLRFAPVRRLPADPDRRTIAVVATGRGTPRIRPGLLSRSSGTWSA